MTPDPNRHEASRPAFEARWPKYSTKKNNGKYVHFPVINAWEEWQAALDWRDAQVCVWKDAGHDFINETGCNRAIAYLASDLVDFPFCPACGRRVKIQETPTTTNTNK